MRPGASVSCRSIGKRNRRFNPPLSKAGPPLAVNPIVVIPARMASTRLPGKPLADINGKPMIVHMLDRGREADIGPVAVACAEAEIAEAVRAAGGRAVLTDPALPSGSDRVHAALAELDPDGRHDVVVNLQGDFPTLDPAGLRLVITPLVDPKVDIGTLVVPIRDETEAATVSFVKAACAFEAGRDDRAGAVFFPPADTLGARGRAGTMSASTPIAGRCSTAMSRCRQARWNGARALNSCGHWRMGCGSLACGWSTDRSGWTPPKTWSAPARCWPAR